MIVYVPVIKGFALKIFLIYNFSTYFSTTTTTGSEHYSAKPLPSAGIIPVLQAFCGNDADVYNENNSRYVVIARANP